MSGYTPKEKFELEFEGDIITYSLSRMTRKEVMVLTPYFMKVKTDESEEAMNAMDKVIDMLPDHVSEFKGLKDAGGNALSFESMFNQSYFIRVVKDMAANLMQISWISKEKGGDEKKSIDTSVVPLQE